MIWMMRIMSQNLICKKFKIIIIKAISNLEMKINLINKVINQEEWALKFQIVVATKVKKQEMTSIILIMMTNNLTI